MKDLTYNAIATGSIVGSLLAAVLIDAGYVSAWIGAATIAFLALAGLAAFVVQREREKSVDQDMGDTFMIRSSHLIDLDNTEWLVGSVIEPEPSNLCLYHVKIDPELERFGMTTVWFYGPDSSHRRNSAMRKRVRPGGHRVGKARARKISEDLLAVG